MSNNSEHSHSPGKKVTCLNWVPIFNNLDDDTTDAVLDIIHPSHYKKGEIVQQVGSKDSRLLVLNNGRAKVVRTNTDGKQQIIAWLKPGDFTGEVGVFAELPSDSEVVALEDSSFCTVDGDRLKEVLENSPNLATSIIRELSRRLEESQRQLEVLGVMNSKQKIVNRLLELSDGKKEFKLPMSKKDLATELGVTPETLSRNLASLVDDGSIKLSGHRVVEIVSLEG